MISETTLKRRIYSKKLEQKVKETLLIPRLINNLEHCKLYHKYWISELGSIAKLSEIVLIDRVEYYFFRYNGGRYNMCTSYPMGYEYVYEMLHSNGIEEVDIINSDTSYTGAEIKFWFIVKDIDLSSKEYSGFWSFLNPRSKNPVVDNKYYFVSYKPDRKQRCQIILDRNKEKL